MRVKYFSAFVISLVAAILVSLWFKDGYIMGTAEGIIPFYNLGRYFDQVKAAWATNIPGLGLPTGIITAYAPTYWFLSRMEMIGIPGFVIEAVLFWFLLTIAGVSIYILGKVLFPKLERRYLIIGSIFYLFNFISLVVVWHRFLFNYMFFWAFLPLGTFIYILGLIRQKYFYALILAIFSVIFSYGFSAPVFVFLFWFLLVFITIFWLIFKGILSEKKFFLKFFFLCLGFFVIFNSWWIGQVYSDLSSGKYEVDKTAFFPDKLNYATFDSLSKSDGKLIYVTRLMHGPFFEEPRVKWASFYTNVLSQILEFTVVGICFFAIVKYRNNFNVLFLAIGLFASIFLVKGNSPPLGEILDFLFKKIPMLIFFRDPFEKFGYLMPLFLSPLLAFSFYNFSTRFRDKFSNIIYVLFLFVIVVFYGYPFFSSLVFTSSTPPTDDYSVGYKVKVPDYYKEASDWLEKQGKNFRFLGMPFRDQGVTYKWEKGYQGVEPYSLLFSTPYIMVNTTVLYYSEIAVQLEPLFLNSINFPNVLNVLNIRYLLIREDIDFRERAMRNPESLIKFLTEGGVKKDFLKSLDFGKLKFWENTSWQDNTFYTASDILNVTPKAKIENTTLDEFNKGSILTSGQLNDFMVDFASKSVIYPKVENNDFDLGVSTQTFELSNPGDYEIVLDNLEITDKDILLPEFKSIYIDDNIKLDVVKLRNDRRFSYGTVNLSSGIHRVTMQIPESDNSITDADKSFTVEKNNIKKVDIVNFNPSAKYMINFRYLSKGANLIFRINQDIDRIRNGSNVPSYEGVLSSMSSVDLDTVNSYKAIFEPIYTSSEMQLEFRSGTAESQIQDLTLKKIFKPSIIMVSSKQAELTQPQISYIKYSPTKYRVSVRNNNGNYALVFSELYNPGWELRLANGEPLGKHFLANAYANGWLIDKRGDYEVIVEFAPQRLLNTGIIISSLAFVGGLVGLGVILVRKRKDRT